MVGIRGSRKVYLYRGQVKATAARFVVAEGLACLGQSKNSIYNI
jgi:hypothetical protein